MTREYEPIYDKRPQPVRLPPKPNIGIKHMVDLSPLRRFRYSNIADFVNPNKVEPIGTVLVDELEVYIERYRATRDTYSIHTTMEVLNKLILKMLHQEIRRYKALGLKDLPDLYNASYVCLHQAMIAFDVSKSSIYSFPRFLQGYIKREVEKYLRWGARYVVCGLSGEDIYPEEIGDEGASHVHQSTILKKIDVHDAMRGLVEEGTVVPESMAMFKMKYLEERTYQEIADESGYPMTLVRERIRAVVKHMKVKLAKYSPK